MKKLREFVVGCVVTWGVIGVVLWAMWELVVWLSETFGCGWGAC